MRVNPFEGEETDDELKYLLLYLAQLRYQENIRSVEKRSGEIGLPDPSVSHIKSVDIGIMHLSLLFLCVICALCGLIIPI